MVSIQKDVYSSVLHFLAQQVVATAAKKAPQSESVKQAVEVLRGWNGQMEAGQAAPMVAALLYAEVKRGIAELAAPGLGGEYNSRMAGPVIERWLTERPEGWVKDYDAWLMAGLAKVVAEGEKTQGSNIARWDYGQYNEFKINSVVLGQLPLVGRYFDAGPRPMSGASTTVKQVTGKVAPSFRMVADLGNLEASVANITVGQSAHRFSPHYRDQFDAYMTGTSFPMQFGKVEAEDTLRVKPN
jgi:penicillin amidase